MSNDFLNAGCPDERICIEVKRVIDEVKKQTTMFGVTIDVIPISPPNPIAPLTFISARSSTVHGAITDLSITRLPAPPRRGRVKCMVGIPLSIEYTDATSTSCTGISTVNIPIDTILHLPPPSAVPFEIEAVVSAVCPVGNFSGMQPIVRREGPPAELINFIVDVCLTLILKEVCLTDIIIPAAHAAVIPDAIDFNQRVCQNFFDLPITPEV